MTSADTVRDALHDPKGLWPVDWLTLAYLAAAGVLVLVGWRRLPDAGWLLALHAGGAALLVGAARSPASRLLACGGGAHRRRLGRAAHPATARP